MQKELFALTLTWRTEAMITNERQFRISNSELEKLRTAFDSFDFPEATKRTGSPILAKAERDALDSQIEDLTEQINEFSTLRSGAVRILKASSLSELPTLLIKGRIAQGLSQRELAQKLGLKEQKIQRYEDESYASASLERLRKIAAAVNISIKEVAELNAPSGSTIALHPAFDWKMFPLNEMYRRNWFASFTGSWPEAKAQAENLINAFVASAGKTNVAVMHRKRVRAGSRLDPTALTAWQLRVLTLAKKKSLSRSYQQEALTDAWIKNFVQESQFSDGPIRAAKRLEDIGIRLIIEPHLPSTHLDGAAFISDLGPVIGMTLRYDRIDNFWFVLLHEVIHVRHHLRRGSLEQIFDDLEADADALESETDALSAKALLPDDVWEIAIARYVRTVESVIALAKDLNIHPAIIAGKIRKEAENYTLLSELIGLGEVRKQFPEVHFGV
jgi:HTH-type transcriptional regulator / antitoxin HigA